MKIYNQNEEKYPIYINKCGDGYENIFEDQYNEKEELNHIKTGRLNRQAMIQSAAKNTDISVLYKKLIQGDTSVLMKNEGVFLDMSEAPKDIFEAQQYQNYINNYFENSELLKKVYNNDFNAYFEDYNKGINHITNKINMFNTELINKMSKEKEKAPNENKQ